MEMPNKRKRKCLSEEKEMPIYPKLNMNQLRNQVGIHTLPLNFCPNKLYPNELL